MNFNDVMPKVQQSQGWPYIAVTDSSSMHCSGEFSTHQMVVKRSCVDVPIGRGLCGCQTFGSRAREGGSNEF